MVALKKQLRITQIGLTHIYYTKINSIKLDEELAESAAQKAKGGSSSDHSGDSDSSEHVEFDHDSLNDDLLDEMLKNNQNLDED